MREWGRWRIGLGLTILATLVRLCWTLAVPTIPVGDFATYRESALYLAEFGHLDPGFVYMPGLVLLLAGLHMAGGDVLAAKLVGVAFGGLAAGPVYMIAARLVSNGQPVPPGQTAPPLPRPSRDPAAGAGSMSAVETGPLVAGLAYALWPAGIAMSSVIGTDVPTAALMVTALALLCTWGETRPVLAALAFGATMGLAAYFRAVALPLTVLSVGYWIALRVGWRATVRRTALAVAMTTVMLLPWGLRNRRENGAFYLTDSHGGITALMGNDPNSEGTHSRALATLFHQLTGRTFLMQPHRVTDRVAYDMAKRWMTFDPAWTAGMIALRTERLLAPERGLLYWPVYRRGVIPPQTLAWFNQHRRAVTDVVDLFYLVLVLGLTAGFAFAVAERRWLVLLPLPFAVMLAATYALFVAEPRYRVTSEVLLFPLFGFGAARLVRAARFRFLRLADRRAVLYTVMGLALLVLLGVAVVRGGATLREHHRWAATVWQVDGQARLAMWRRGERGTGLSPVRGLSSGAALLLRADQNQAAAQIVLPDVGLPGGPATRRSAHIDAVLSWRGTTAPEDATLTVGGVGVPAGTSRLSGLIEFGEFPPRIEARLAAASGARKDELAVAITDVTLTAMTDTAAAPP